MFLDYDPPMKKLAEEFVPHSRVSLLAYYYFLFPWAILFFIMFGVIRMARRQK